MYAFPKAFGFKIRYILLWAIYPHSFNPILYSGPATSWISGFSNQLPFLECA